MTTQTARKPRPRRIAADEAHSWARNLRLRNTIAKFVLCTLTQYVNGEGACFVGIPTLADDCELSQETVRKRLAWLEQVGAIARFAQWVDDAGRRNGDGRGRRTTDEIRLLLSADPDDIEARAAGENPDDHAHSDVSDPQPHGGSDPLQDGGSNPAGTLAGLQRPSTCVEGVDSSEPEPEDSPQAPQGGLHDDVVEGWEEFKSAFEADGDPIMRVSISKTLFAALGHEERQSATAAARGLVAKRSRERKPGAKPSAQTFLRERDAWPAFAKLAPSAPEEEITVHRGTPEFRAAAVYVLLVKDKSISGDRIVGRRSLFEMPDFLALATLADENGQVDTTTWCGLRAEADKASIGAWRERIKRWSGIWIEMRKIPEVDHAGEPIVRIHEHNGESLKFPVTFDGLLVPKPYPPRTDGTWPDGNLAKTG